MSMASTQANVQEIARTMRLFVPPGQLGEVRIIRPSGGTLGFFFAFEQIEQAARDARAPSKTPRREGESDAKKAVAGLKKRVAKSGAEVSLKRVKGAWVAVMVVPIEKIGLIKG